MRTRWLAFAVAALAAHPATAHATKDPPTVSVTHWAPVPCAVACPYWETPRSLGFDPCAAPFPLGSWDETTFVITEDPALIRLTSRPTWDYDTFVCTDTTPSRLVLNLANVLHEDCHMGTVSGRMIIPLQCEETGYLSLAYLRRVNDAANDRFIIRSFNWSDLGSTPVDVWGPVEIVDDSYGDLPI